MRGLLTAITIVFVAALASAAILLLASGRSFTYAGAGHSRSIGVAFHWCWGALAGGLVAALLLEIAARVLPRIYYRLQAWRDFALGVSLVAGLGVVALYMGRALIHGAF
jgi:hypothetical protein